MIGLVAPLIRGALAPTARRHHAAWRDPAAAQQRARERIWAGLRETAYGARTTRFEDLPVVTWEEVAPWVARQAQGERGVVTHDRVLFWEPTSGSTGPPKRIPYTAALRSAFSGMFAVWAHDVLAHGPPMANGKMWFSVTPRFGDVSASGDGAPVGTADDRDYLDGPLRMLLSPFWLAPADAATARDPEAWRRLVATALCAAPDLVVMSVWSPVLLLVLLDWMVEHRGELPRSELIGDWTRLWPALRLVSCWDAASSHAPAERLRRELPGVLVQGKGLLATEGPITVPLIGLEGATAPLLVDGVLELLGPHGDLLPIAHAEDGGTYEVVLSQPAGLARLRLGDMVEVRGRVHDTPGLRFLGRARTVDLVGEKLSEAVVAAAFAAAGVPPGCCLVPGDRGYTLEVDALVVPEGLVERVDVRLRAHHHYRLAVELGQLAPLAGRAVPGRAQRELERATVWGGAKGGVLGAPPAATRTY